MKFSASTPNPLYSRTVEKEAGLRNGPNDDDSEREFVAVCANLCLMSFGEKLDMQE